jgi:exosome complex exonuclease DIS3/RRP44
MEYKVNILDHSYNSFEFINNTETLLLILDDIINFKQFRFFHNDIIIYDKEQKDILKIKESSIKDKRIIGTLRVSNHMIYGLNNKKNPYYIFEPIEKHYPNFLVAINDKKIINSNKYQYIIIRFNRWEQKLPYGELIKILGEVGKEQVEYNRILNHYNIDQRKLQLNRKFKVKGNTKLFDIVTEDDLKDYVDIRDKFTFAVDPKGCKDVDDALTYEYIDNQHIVGIHIADVSYFIDKLDLYYFIQKKFFTIYCPDKKFNIFPNVLADHLFSLKCKQDRLALSLFVYLDDDFKMIKYEIKKTIVSLNKNMTYEQANKLIKSNKGTITKMFEISKEIKKLLSEEQTELPENYDSHNMIENFMLLANKLTAEYLIENNKNPILRVHNEPKFNLDLTDCQIKNQEVLDFLKYYQMECAIYKDFNQDNEYNYYHYGLNLKYYTHFTSPIRRVIDIIIHLQLKEILDNKPSEILKKIQVDCNNVNMQQKKNKKMFREMDTINIINNKLIEKTYESYIIDFKDNQLSIYIPELKYLSRKKLYNKKLLNLIEFKITNDKITMENINTNKQITFQKYQNLKIKLLKKVSKIDISTVDIDLMSIHL